MDKLIRAIEVFGKGKNEKLEEEIILDPLAINFAELRELFCVTEDIYLYDGYEITKNEADYFYEKFNLSFKFDFANKTYFLGCYTVANSE